ncbi:hypothetical protein FDR10_19165 [Salmonella enterica]|nr:hypothetical protein [Salmonella enterica]EDW5132321.1 hypothetical protein [Salmonella enterica]
MPDSDASVLSNLYTRLCRIDKQNPAEALRDPHKSALINQHHILVGSGEVIQNGAQHRSF